MNKLLLALALLAATMPGRAGADQPTYDFDFGALLYGPPTGDDGQTTLAVDSVAGNDVNPGTLQSPKRTLPATLANSANLGLYRGSSFRASLPLTTASASNNLSVRGLSLTPGALPVISALDPVNIGTIENNGDDTYSYLWTPTETISADGYSNVYVVEINTATEASTPIASRRRMLDVASRDAVTDQLGSDYIQPPGTGAGQSGSATQWKVTFHPSDNQAPGSSGSLYRYEVVSRVQPADWGTGNAGSGVMSGLALAGGSSGYGSLTGPANIAGDRLAFVHSTTHSAVIGGGSLQRSVFYETGHGTSASGSCIQIAWYAPDGAGLSWTLDRCLFYANVGQDPANCVVSHCGGTNYDRGDVTDSMFLGARRPDGSLQGTAFDYYTVNNGTINRVYVQGIRDVSGNAMPATLETENCVFRGVHRVLAYGQMHDNIVQVVNGAGPGDLDNRYPTAVIFGANGATVSNNLFWAHTETASGLSNDDQINGISTVATGGLSSPATGCTVARNIIVLDPANTTLRQTYAFLSNNSTSNHTIDYNLVINLAKAGFAATDGTTNFFSWSDYVNATGHDQHSLYLDLSRDPRGLQAVFADPANGDFRWAQTDVAAECMAYCQANVVGPATVITHWPVVPTVDEAVAALSLLPPAITSPSAVTFTKDAYGKYRITTDLDGTPDAPTSYGVASQPSWLSMDASNGLASGTPSQTGSTSLSVSATNKAGTSSMVLGITVQTAFAAWQNTCFTAAELNDPTTSGPSATPAGDGIPNLLKYALGLNPKSNGTSALPTISYTTIAGAKFLTLTYNKSLAATDVIYTVEVSGDLQAWSSGVTDTATVSITTNAANTMQTVVQRDLTPISGAKQRFIRLKVSQR